MKTLIGIIILSISFSSCSNGQSENLDLNTELRKFFDSELQRFNKIKRDTSIQIKRIESIDKHFRESTNSRATQINLENLNWYNIEQKLLLPFRNGTVSDDQFIEIIDTINIKFAEYIPLHFQKYRFRQFANNDELLKKVVQLSENYGQTKGYLIRATQRPEESKQEIIDSIRSEQFYISRHPEIDILLSRYSELGNDKETLELLEYAINKLPKGTRLRWNPAGDATNVFERLLNNGSEETKSATLLLMYKFLNKSATTAALQFHHILSQEISDDIKKLMNSKLAKQESINSSDELRKEEKSFFQNYLSSYANNFRTDAIPLIEKAIILDSSKIKFDENGINFRISNYQDKVVVSNGVQALLSMSKLNNLSETEKDKIYNTFLKSNLLKAKGYFWRDVIKLIENLYPNSKYSNYKEIFSNIPESSRYVSIESYWNRNRYSTSELQNYLDFFASINVDTSQIDTKEIQRFNKKYSNDDRKTVIWGVLNLLGISINYDCETGVWPNHYDELINQYHSLSKELERFRPLLKYEKVGEGFETRYTCAIYNGSYGYLSKPKDNGDWYDPNTIERMLNLALEEVGSKKRFIQLNTGDQTVLSVYAEPGQVKKISERFDIKLVNEY